MIFTRDDILARLREQPFTPMQIVTTTGQAYDIYHPDLVWPARNFLMIGTPRPEEPSVPDRVTRVALVHVTELRDLPTPPPPGSNGPVSG
jgi:hypothetical protein